MSGVINTTNASNYATEKSFALQIFNLTLFSANISQLIVAGRQKTGDWGAVVGLASASIALQLVVFIIVGIMSWIRLAPLQDPGVLHASVDKRLTVLNSVVLVISFILILINATNTALLNSVAST